MPEVASRLLKSFDDDNIGLAQIAALIEKDAALTAKVLRLANSAHYSPRTRSRRSSTPRMPWGSKSCAIWPWPPA